MVRASLALLPVCRECMGTMESIFIYVPPLATQPKEKKIKAQRFSHDMFSLSLLLPFRVSVFIKVISAYYRTKTGFVYKKGKGHYLS